MVELYSKILEESSSQRYPELKGKVRWKKPLYVLLSKTRRFPFHDREDIFSDAVASFLSRLDYIMSAYKGGDIGAFVARSFINCSSTVLRRWLVLFDRNQHCSLSENLAGVNWKGDYSVDHDLIIQVFHKYLKDRDREDIVAFSEAVCRGDIRLNAAGQIKAVNKNKRNILRDLFSDFLEDEVVF